MKRFLIVLTVVAVLAGAFVLTGCVDDNNKAKSYKDVYLVSAIAGANYLRDAENGTTASADVFGSERVFVASATGAGGAVRNDNGGTALSRPTEIAQDIDALNSYINMFDGLISDKSLNAELTTPNEAEDGEYASYSKKLTAYVGTDSYVMYYNEVDSHTEEEIDDGEKEVEITTTLEGVLVNADDVFEVRGKRQVETEGNETETEIEFTTRSKTNPDNYVKVEQSVENDEIEYEYSIYEDGKLVSKTQVEWEKAEFELDFDDDDDDEGLTIQFKNISDGNASKTKYHITTGKNGILIVAYKTEISRGKFQIQQSATENIYTYPNGFSETLSR